MSHMFVHLVCWQNAPKDDKSPTKRTCILQRLLTVESNMRLPDGSGKTTLKMEV
jgi:hypothetical protein